MVSGRLTVLLALALEAVAVLHPSSSVSGDFLSPLLSPVLNGLCKAVYCGKGSCKVAEDTTFGFQCECDSGWTQFHIEDHFRFLPCLMPNCSMNYSCSNTSSAPPSPAPSPLPPDGSAIFDPCKWSYCGGGECIRASAFEHRCECKQGYDNLLNISSFPCFQDCSFGADCANLGFGLSNSSSAHSSPPNLADNGESSSGDANALKNSLWLGLLLVFLAVI